MNSEPENDSKLFQAVKSEIAKVIVGQEEMIELMLYALLAGGHILLEGVPGLAKSLAVETFARVIGGDFRRFQFTPDKMPGDITGTMIYNEKERRFEYYFGPVFCNIFLGDEINRASPKVQSALLQAMQEKQVDVERERYDLPDPFMVLATQNPIEQSGTYPLSEAQTDRFMVKYNVGYPTREEEAELLLRKHSLFEAMKADVRKITSADDLLLMRKMVREKIQVTKTVMNYILNICTATRPPENYQENLSETDICSYIRLGASPRAAESLLAISKSCAFCHDRDYVRFDDVNQCASHVLRHRILLNHKAFAEQITADRIIREILRTIPAY